MEIRKEYTAGYTGYKNASYLGKSIKYKIVMDKDRYKKYKEEYIKDLDELEQREYTVSLSLRLFSYVVLIILSSVYIYLNFGTGNLNIFGLSMVSLLYLMLNDLYVLPMIKSLYNLSYGYKLEYEIHRNNIKKDIRLKNDEDIKEKLVELGYLRWL